MFTKLVAKVQARTQAKRLLEQKLIQAAKLGHVQEFFSALGSDLIDVNAVEADTGMTALMYASYAGNEEFVLALLERDADPEVFDINLRANALLLATSRKHSSVVGLLLDYDAQINHVGSDQITALMLAVSASDHPTLDVLLEFIPEKSSHLEARPRLESRTPLMTALYNEDAIAVKKLLDKGAQCRPYAHFDPLMDAVYSKNPTIVQLVLATGTPINGKKSEPLTPLMLAAARGHEAIVQVLIEANAKLDLVSPLTGQTALDLAKEMNHPGVVKLLEQAAQKEAQVQEEAPSASKVLTHLRDLVIGRQPGDQSRTALLQQGPSQGYGTADRYTPPI